MPDHSQLARLPKMDRILAAEPLAGAGWRRDVVRRVVGELLDGLRTSIREGEAVEIPDAAGLAARAHADLERYASPRPRRVINATGVVLHTNLGRAPLSREAIAAMGEAAVSCDLELDLADGKRGSRFTALQPALRLALGAEDAHVVGNNAAALLLACTVLGTPGGVVLSRGQLVEIGDGFRVATMAAAGGCRVVAVGSTNRTHPRDYELALDGEGPDDGGTPASAVLWAHASNFVQEGFVKEVDLPQLAAIARAREVPLIADLGSGSLGAGLPAGEPTVQFYLEQGADLVLASGDKLLGGPQAGIIAGRRDLVHRCRRHPMARALRPDKTSLAALHATFAAHLRDGAPDLPLHRMVGARLEDLEARGVALCDALGWPADHVVRTDATVGGGSLPGETMESRAVRVPTSRATRDATRLRTGATPVVGRIDAGALLLDLRTVDPADDAVLIEALKALSGSA